MIALYLRDVRLGFRSGGGAMIAVSVGLFMSFRPVAPALRALVAIKFVADRPSLRCTDVLASGGL